jgi:hypothetical protein
MDAGLVWGSTGLESVSLISRPGHFHLEPGPWGAVKIKRSVLG